MTTPSRAKLEQLISDSCTYVAGQDEERRRIQHLLDIRIGELRSGVPVPHNMAIVSELLRIRQSLTPC